MVAKMGFACKWIDHPDQVNGIKPTDDAKKYNTGGTTVAWLSRQTREVAEQKLWDLMVQNTESTYQLVNRVGNLDEHLRMVRISSDILPVYTHDSWRYFWRMPDVINYLGTAFSKVGDRARSSGVRLSFHPGQFTVLASDSDSIVSRSIEEFEYHADMARYMGYGKQFQDFKINVHIAGRQGPEGIRRALQRLSPEARNTITIENDEFTWGLDSSLDLVNDCALVLDIHHHFIHSDGEYIQSDDDRIKRLIDSWRGVRPAFHYSVSREDVLENHCCNTLPNLNKSLKSGKTKSLLRAHSDFMWNNAVNQWALSHLSWGDCMVEAKAKNLASFSLYESAKILSIL